MSTTDRKTNCLTVIGDTLLTHNRVPFDTAVGFIHTIKTITRDSQKALLLRIDRNLRLINKLTCDTTVSFPITKSATDRKRVALKVIGDTLLIHNRVPFDAAVSFISLYIKDDNKR